MGNRIIELISYARLTGIGAPTVANRPKAFLLNGTMGGRNVGYDGKTVMEQFVDNSFYGTGGNYDSK